MGVDEPTSSRPEAATRSAPTAGFVTVDANGQDIPVDLAAWIDERDPEPTVPADPDEDEAIAADRALDEQRSEHEPAGRDANDALGALVNNTGDDGGAASG